MLPSSSPPQSPAVGGGVWSCGCLNWSLHCQEVQPCQLLTAPDDPFFATGVARAKLAPQGITKRHGFLERRRLVGEWEVHGCRGCQQDVYAASSSGDLLLSAQLEVCRPVPVRCFVERHWVPLLWCRVTGAGWKPCVPRPTSPPASTSCCRPGRPRDPPPSQQQQASSRRRRACRRGWQCRSWPRASCSRSWRPWRHASGCTRSSKRRPWSGSGCALGETGRPSASCCPRPPQLPLTGLAWRRRVPAAAQDRRRQGGPDGNTDDGRTRCSGWMDSRTTRQRSRPRRRRRKRGTPMYAVEHDRIGADIEALARSVCDGTEMFGDLPRPRLNSTHRALF
ncbi:proline-rich Akt substrate 40 kDa isoform X6 [Haemaphysalis longicornis]